MKKEELNDLLKELEDRGLLSNFANVENFLSLEEKERTIYWGVDCTSDSLHIGHLSNIIQLFRMSERKFKVIFILGGSTTTIGDPSDKLKERPLIENQTIGENYKSIEKQLNSIIYRTTNEVSEENKPLSQFYKNETLEKIYNCLNLKIKESPRITWKEFIDKVLPKKSKDNFLILNNREWLSKINFIDFINKYGRKITVNYLLSKETVKQRIAKNGISFSEFSYPLLQAYDFLHLYENYGCRGQLGASDQWGNFSTGLKMIRSNFQNNKSFAISLNLILDKNGKKISKSGSKTSVVWLSKEKTQLDDLFDYFNNMEDKESINFVKRFTSISKQELNNLLEINEPKSMRILQRIALETFFFLIHGNEGINWIRNKKVKVY